ncbi:MAG: TerD family protein [bacterium]|nr:TerD family protein [bacterium]
MAINLKKGQKVSLRKNNRGSAGGQLRQITVGLGWDPVAPKGILGFLGITPEIDCDVSCCLCKNGRLEDLQDLIYYGDLKHYSGAVRHMGDNLTGDGEGDDEQLFVNLENIPSQYDRLIFSVNIYEAYQRKQDFGMIRNAFIRIVDNDTYMEICRYNLSEHYSGMTAMIFGEIFRDGNGWQFAAIGDPTKDRSISELVSKFK